MNNALEAHIEDMDGFFYGGNIWQAGLFQLVEGLTLEQALWKPSEDRHCIWNVVKHIIFWKTYAIAYIRKTQKPDYEKDNWSKLPDAPSVNDWQNELKLLKENHDEFKNLIRNFGAELFNTENKEANYIREIINHDSYHSGQIGLLRVMQGLKPIE